MVHTFKIDDTNVILDVYSGAVHTADDMMVDIINAMENKAPKDSEQIENIISKLGQKYDSIDIKECYEDIKELYKEGLLFTEDSYAKIAENWHKDSVVKAMCLHIAHDCNLRCEYCFAGTGSYEGERSLMSAEVGRASIDYVIKNSGSRKNIEIDFFGGEPLVNFDVVKQIVEYARQEEKKYDKNFRFTITTNGILLDDEKMKYINENMVNIVLSLDGRKEVNDKVRKRIDGSGSYDSIVDKFIKMADSRNQDNYYVRGTFTRYNLDFANDVMHLADLGFKQISVEPVVAEETEPYAIREEDIDKINEEYEKLAVMYMNRKKEGKGFNFFHFMIDLDGGPCVVKRLSGCGSGHEYVAVAPNGDIYPCHQFVGDDKMKMGNVRENTLNKEIKTTFEKSNIYTKPACRDCFAKFYCSGGCPANAYKYCGDINTPLELSCKLQRKRVECALYCAVKKAEMENSD